MTTTTTLPWTDAVRRFIDDPARFAILSTLAEDGVPAQAVAWYAVRDEGILVNSLVGRRWPANLERHPECSLMVEDGYRYVVISGRAEIIATGAPALADIQALARRYGTDPGSFEGQPRISFLIHPERVGTHGGIA